MKRWYLHSCWLAFLLGTATPSVVWGQEELGEDWRFSGWLDMGYSYASTGPGLLAVAPDFNRFGREFLLNQSAFVIERPLKQEPFAVGFYTQLLGGADAAFLAGPGDPDTGNPRMGIVVRQLHASVHLPLLSDGGVDVALGRRASPMGYESYMPQHRLFYSLSYQWNYVETGAATGLWATWHANPTLDLLAGLTLGSNSFFELQGDGPSLVLQASQKLFGEDRTVFTATLAAGDEAVGVTTPINPGSFATALELRLRHQWTEWFAQTVQANVGGDQNVPEVGTGQWRGVLTAGELKLTNEVRFALGYEWFDDLQGTRTGVATNYQAVTGAVIWQPKPWLMFRPELRGDFAGQPAFGPVSEPMRRTTQFTAALECFIAF